jgi:alkylation response protein AidB-like acyl-CoA dehydrogenase
MPNLPEQRVIDEAVLSALAANADRADTETAWPAASWQLLRGAGALRWSIPQEFGGMGWGAVDLLAGYERLAGACLTTAFILSQREAAVRRLLANANPEQKRRYLPALAAGDRLMSVGLAQLTTSRQHQAPALVATPAGADRYRLDGVIPWVTSADQCDTLVVGGTLADRRQLLLLLPVGQRGVIVEPPLRLAALVGSRTALVRCDGVELEADQVLAGPVERVLGSSKGGVGGLETSCLALGLAGAAIDYLAGDARARPDLSEAAARFEQARRSLRARLLQLAAQEAEGEPLVRIRVACNRLVLRASQTALLAAKGTGFVAGHPAQRWARQALFFLVWSCPRPAAEGMLAELLPAEGEA